MAKNVREKRHNDSFDNDQSSKLNWLRASVLGANDGIVSIAGLVVGVAGAGSSIQVILSSGLAGIIAGAISMAAGEYVSVSSQRDTEKSLLKKEIYELKKFPKQELNELAVIYEKKGLSRKTAMVVAKELTNKDVQAAHFDAELGIDPKKLTNPWHAAFASAASFCVGAVIPLVFILLPPEIIRVQVVFVAVVIALVMTGYLSAKVGGANKSRAIIRVVSGGILAMAATYMIGRIFHISSL